ncbi:hypothetical protein GIB67_040269 [Kingdonia uniflora]|uniref:Uncharacterized protein n=1 Tax=Kingdonia uniflora TaxID=39325 RepID=A0A7J7MV23_9MAGN|nr:hypothetical protein GIB67_040269 [Kingdonia uniflora]
MEEERMLKKPKLERDDNGGGGVDVDDVEKEEALVALIEHRTKEVEHLDQRLRYYTSQLEQAERKLNDSLSKLARLRSRDNSTGSKNLLGDGSVNVKVDRKTSGPVTPISTNESNSRSQVQSRPQLVIPAVNPKIAQPVKLAESNSKSTVGSGSRASSSYATQSNGVGKLKGDSPYKPSAELATTESHAQTTKNPKEHKEVIPLIRSYASASLIHCHSGVHISSQHKRKLRCLTLCPTNDQLFVTSALDGVVNLWQVLGKGSSASLLSTTECASSKDRKWPEDITWNPLGDRLFSVYSADVGDSQISILNLNSTQRGKRITYLEGTPHLKGLINSVVFMPWDNSCFATAGSDHAVVLWKEGEGENSWKPKTLHRNMHSSAVMGVAGLQQKQIVMSVGADKRIIGYDVQTGRSDFKHQLESKCMSVLPNPSDFNLFMVQTGAHENQLRLYDIRLRKTEIHAFGWKQESSESQSALINQAWSPDGLYLTSGSADPRIHIFDIRYNSTKPSQSVKAHQKRVFKAVWLNSLPLLISISSDLQIGLHRIS